MDTYENESVGYLMCMPIFDCTYLRQVIHNTDDVDIITQSIDKLPHDRAVRDAVFYSKFDIADLLIDKQVKYDPKELEYNTPESILWAKKHNFNIALGQVDGYHYAPCVTTTLLEEYPHLLADMDLCKCITSVLIHILTKYEVEVTDSLVRRILHIGSDMCLQQIIRRIDVDSYMNEFAISSFSIVHCVLYNTHLSVNDFGMKLFTGQDIKRKLEKFSPLINNFASKAKEYNLLQTIIDIGNSAAALYLLQEYNICLEGLDEVNTARVIITRELGIFIKLGIIDEDGSDRIKNSISNCASVEDVLSTYRTLSK